MRTVDYSAIEMVLDCTEVQIRTSRAPLSGGGSLADILFVENRKNTSIYINLHN
jgi:hypothetical protein